nr:putative ribonuclease H-like domain-containing protein [Tanacetum cinerariifolium]
MKDVGFNEYCDVPPPPAQVYSPLKKDLSWMGLPEFVDDTVTDYTRPTPSIDVSKSGILQDNIDDKGYWDSGCSRHMTRNISYLSENNLLLSSTEAEYVAAAGCCTNILWMKSQLTDYDVIYEKVPIYYDSTSAIAISNNPFLHSRTKHTDIRHHFSIDHILKGHIELHFIPNQYQLADIFTKPLDEPTFKRLIVELGRKGFRLSGLSRVIEENLHVDFLENKSIEKGTGLDWLFDIDTLTNSMNYVPVVVSGTYSNIADTKKDAHQAVKEKESPLRFIALPNWFHEAQMATSNEVAKKVMQFQTIILHKRSNKRHKTKDVDEQSFIAIIHQKTNPDLLLYCLFSCFILQEKPKKIVDALKDPSWVEAMQQELLQFKIQNVWVLVDCPNRVRPIRTKWVLKNKKDERGIVIRNKARLVAQRHTQEEGIDYEEVFAHVARIEAIRLFLAYASYMGFTVYQMDVKSAYLYEAIDEEVYVMQPPSFQDLEFPHRVYKVEKAMYGLHQAPRAWYGILSKYLLDNGFQRGTIDQVLFFRKHKGEFLLVQVYVDYIIFGSSNPKLCREFEALMHDKFQMSAMGELNFFLGLQVLQKTDGIFLLQDKYVGNILKIFRYIDIRAAKTPMDRENP